MSISNDLWFYLEGVDKLDDTWKKLTTIFDKHDEIQAH
jgi:hypothetical protein